MDNARKDAAASLTKIEQKLQDTIAQGIKLKTINKTLAEKQKQLTAQKFEIPSGEIRWVDQRTGTAWINLGRADSLQRQVTFGVYPADITDMTTGGKKASIEVTQVLGDHLAEAHVFDDKLVDPIMPGDKIYTPVWIPGEKRHFALAGFLDPNGEGKNDVQTVKDIIAVNGGVVDCYLDDKGKKVGDMTVNTRYLVLGEAPTEKSQPAIAGITKMLTRGRAAGSPEDPTQRLAPAHGLEEPDADRPLWPRREPQRFRGQAGPRSAREHPAATSATCSRSAIRRPEPRPAAY